MEELSLQRVQKVVKINQCCAISPAWVLRTQSFGLDKFSNRLEVLKAESIPFNPKKAEIAIARIQSLV
jgi:hypothetical protein